MFDLATKTTVNSRPGWHANPGPRPLKVVMVSDYESMGGANIAASRLAEALVDAGHEVIRLVGRGDETLHPWRTIELGFRPRAERLAQLLTIRDHPELWLQPAIERQLHHVLEKIEPDVVNLHNLHGHRTRGWSPNFSSIAMDHAPTVWTLHDMWSFTGRCAYRGNCDRHFTGCDASCPTPSEYPQLAAHRIHGAWKQRVDLMDSLPNLVAVTPSAWLSDEARRGMWRGRRVDTIPNSVPLDSYTPIDRQVARQALGLPRESRILAVAAQDLTDPRKGMHLLTDALQFAAKTQGPLTLLALGHGRLPEIEGITTFAYGHIDDDRLKAVVYSAAELFLHPALEDNLPAVVQEALACGTPIVSFASCGLPEMVIEGETGWLVEERTTTALATTIRRSLQSSAEGPSREKCRKFAQKNYDPVLQAHQYISLFSELLTRPSDQPVR